MEEGLDNSRKVISSARFDQRRDYARSAQAEGFEALQRGLGQCNAQL